MAGMTVTLTLTAEQMGEIARMVAAEMPKRPADRTADMVERYGEACSKETAAQIIGVSRSTMYRMIEAGQVSMACAGTRVDVRSLADYIEGRGHAET